MRAITRRVTLVAALAAAFAPDALAQMVDVASDMRWRMIGPVRAGRGRSAVGVPTQPNVFYVGFDNGGVWRSTDYGSNWTPLFDEQSTGSIGAIAIAPSDPNVIYVGSGAGIIRPDLATGDGMYKSTDAGRTWTHLGLRESQMISYVDVDPRDPNRLFVSVLGHPYGPNTERGHLPLHEWRAVVRAGVVQGRVHEWRRRPHRPEQSEHGVRGAVAAAAELHRGPGIRRRG